MILSKDIHNYKDTILMVFSALILLSSGLNAADTLKIDQVMAFPPELNVSGGGEYVSIGYSLSEDARVRIIIYGPQHEQIKVLQDWTGQGSGGHSVRWDGKDHSGTVVGDEAYYFTIEAENSGGSAVYDPTIGSGGQRLTPQNVSLDRAGDKISYTLPRMARVLVRAGIHHGPLCDTGGDSMAR